MLEHTAEKSIKFLWKNWFYWVMAMLIMYLLILSSTIFVSINSDFMVVLFAAIFAHNFFVAGLGWELEKKENLNAFSFSGKWMFIFNFYVFAIFAPVYLVSECIYECYIA
jgi:hypothetical protein